MLYNSITMHDVKNIKNHSVLGHRFLFETLHLQLFRSIKDHLQG